MTVEELTVATGKGRSRPRAAASFSGPPPEAIRLAFARRLQASLNERGWTQSELARRVAPLLKESRIGRDNISKYVRGKVLPLPAALEAIAKVLEMRSQDLLPARASVGNDENPPFSMRDMGDQQMVWVQVNMALPWNKALELHKIIRSKDDDDTGRDGA